ncbi:CDGSH iron-sulfur domain-containing protein 2 like protein [Ditylenchus destructor]|uniref:CDGSH iron-sulfur domain-containing protein 2 like protein n=1 Tax=Ditylenchus destructor TaxID=166010 RepID=A0AAD4N0P8_9BILA|nr:CDGSH iron-sulfur domain-containing protein 2 like protein [Ditylenchus destructor]
MVAQDTISLSPAKAALYATAILGGGVVIGYLVSKKLTKGNRCNHKVKLDCDKIVDTVDIEDGGQKQAFCRCWHSKQVSESLRACDKYVCIGRVL